MVSDLKPCFIIGTESSRGMGSPGINSSGRGNTGGGKGPRRLTLPTRESGLGIVSNQAARGSWNQQGGAEEPCSRV